MDRQLCSIIFQSSAYTNLEVKYQWRNTSKLPFIHGMAHQDEMTPEIKVVGYRLRKGTSLKDELSWPREYDQFIVDLLLERPIGYFLWEVKLFKNSTR